MTSSFHSPEYARLTALLLRARKQAGLTQQQLADRLGKPQSYVAKVERGERRIDPVEFVLIARALGQSPETLFGAFVEEI